MDKKNLIRIANFCVYQDRTQQEVREKLASWNIDEEEAEEMIAFLITENYLNEERFARSFARGKHRIKSWGKIRIVNELKQRHISAPNIKAALTEITEEQYQATFHQLAERHWQSLTERKGQKKNKKFCDYLLRRGWESHLVYEKMKELEE